MQRLLGISAVYSIGERLGTDYRQHYISPDLERSHIGLYSAIAAIAKYTLLFPGGQCELSKFHCLLVCYSCGFCELCRTRDVASGVANHAIPCIHQGSGGFAAPADCVFPWRSSW